jgi:hypothetical protein
MLTSYEDIKEGLAPFQGQNYPEDQLHEYTESLLPIYYSEIIQEWTDLDAEYRDTWQEYGVAPESTIYSLMSIDLFNYYDEQVNRAYYELYGNKEGN